jgi:HicB family
MKMVDRRINRLVWSPAEQRILGRLPDLPSVSSLAASLINVVNGTIGAITESVADPRNAAVHDGSVRNAGASLMVATAPALRARLAAEAAERGVSLNEWANLKLALPAGAVRRAGTRDDWRVSAYGPRC